jgi:hypothetical protein
MPRPGPRPRARAKVPEEGHVRPWANPNTSKSMEVPRGPGKGQGQRPSGAFEGLGGTPLAILEPLGLLARPLAFPWIACNRVRLGGRILDATTGP